MGKIPYSLLKRTIMIVILEGPDGAGKSTLKAELVKQFDFIEPIPKSLPTHKSTETMCGENAAALNLAIYNNKNVVLDRGWMSEDIYSKVLREAPSRFDQAHKAMFERLALTAGVVVVLCNPGRQEIVNNLFVRGDEHIRDLSVLNNIIREYENFERLTSLPVIHYNYKKHKVCNILDAIWDKQEGGHTGKSVFGNGYAETLIVTKLDKSKPIGYVPMVSWVPGSQGYELTHAISDFGLKESDLAWTMAQGSALRNLVVGNHYKRVAYVGAELAISTESVLDGLPVDVRYIPITGNGLVHHLEGWL
jgi:adenylate kinase family enzyme